MKPFLFLGTRAEDAAADSEYAAVLACSGLDERDVRRHRLEAAALGPVDLDGLSGVILGGGPFNSSDPQESKSAVQVRVEAELRDLAERVVERDFPFLGACYGVGTLGGLHGGLVDRTYGEPVSATLITLTDAGVADPLLGTMPREFEAFLGHKEAVTRLPGGAVLLASSAACPVQAFRLGAHVYATQFHPELDVEGICLRIDTYQHHGYFAPEEAADIKAMARASHVEHPGRLLAAFADRYGRP
jgi:GMP synthase (glutamine-hydrolysing)